MSGLRVLDLSQAIAGPYCTRLLVDDGADVVKVERPGRGDPARRLGPFPGDRPDPEHSGQFVYLNAGKRGITLDLQDASDADVLRRLARESDVLVESFRPGTMDRLGVGFPALHAINPRLVVCSISSFGQTGPYSRYEATELVLEALGGYVYPYGEPDREPLGLPFPMAQYVCGVHAYIAILAAEALVASTGRGQHLDVSAMEALVSLQDSYLAAQAYSGVKRGRVGNQIGDGYPSRIMRCKDGFVFVQVVTTRDWEETLRLAAREDLISDPRFATAPDRHRNRDAVDAALAPWLAAHEAADVARIGQEHGLPFAIVASARDVLESPQLASRDYFRVVAQAGGFRLRVPGTPFRELAPAPPRTALGPAPALGEHTAIVLGALSDEPAPETEAFALSPGPRPALPLDGIRILDLTQVWAGPKCTQVLADLGAEVIKVESPGRPDPARGSRGSRDRYPDGQPGVRPYNRIASFNSHNRGKKGITLDLRTADGAALFRDLLRLSDVVTENFRAGVMERLGLGYAVLQGITPDIVLLSMPGFGSTGPARDAVAYAGAIEATAGLMRTTGYTPDAPFPSNHAYSDPLAGLFGAAAVLSALRQRRLTGRGQHVEVAQLEALVNVNAAALCDSQLNGREAAARGNTHPAYAPHGVYPCRGEDSWVAIAVRSDAEWARLARAIGNPAWATQPRFATAAARRQRSRTIDTGLCDWTRRHSAAEATAILQALGIPAGAASTPDDLMRDPHLAARGRFESIDHPDAGRHTYYRPFPVSFSACELRNQRPAPLFGQHNVEILGGLLGLSTARLRQLAEQGIIADAPRQAPPIA